MDTIDDSTGLHRSRSSSHVTVAVLTGSVLAVCLTILIATKMVLSFMGGMTINPLPSEKVGTIKSQGPTVLQLKKMQHLVSTQIHISDVMIAESTWLQGSWLIRGDALLAVDMATAEITEKDDETRTASILIAQPQVMSPRVDHERTQEWDIKGRSWIPLSASLLGNKEALKRNVMIEAQNVIARVASQPEYRDKAKKNVEGTLSELYSQMGWTVSVQWR